MISPYIYYKPHIYDKIVIHRGNGNYLYYDVDKFEYKDRYSQCDSCLNREGNETKGYSIKTGYLYVCPTCYNLATTKQLDMILAENWFE